MKGGGDGGDLKIHRDGSLEFVFRNGQSVIERVKP